MPNLTDPFVRRHIGPSPAEQQEMLQTLGYDSLDALMAAAIPKGIRHGGLEALPPALSEAEVLARLRELAERNHPGVAMIGLGYHPTVTPAVIRRNVLEDPSWYTAYTPYQPEISQGRLEALINFQTMVADLTGLTTANASLLDEGTAAGEALTLIRRATRGKDDLPIIVDAGLLPQTRAVVETRAEALGIELVEADLADGPSDIEAAGVVIAYPRADGRIVDPSAAIEAAHATGGLAVVVTDPLALVMLTSPGSLGADVVVGSSQRFGVPMFYGGPHAAFMAVREGLERQLPGRLVGVSVDAAGRPAYRLALQTREQHIRREKATSNICTAQVLLAVAASMYAVYHGPDGLRRIAEHVNDKARTLAAGLRAGGVEIVAEEFFDTVVARVPGRAVDVVKAAHADGIHLRGVDDDHVGITTSETTTTNHIARVLSAFGIESVLQPTPWRPSRPRCCAATRS